MKLGGVFGIAVDGDACFLRHLRDLLDIGSNGVGRDGLFAGCIGYFDSTAPRLGRLASNADEYLGKVQKECADAGVECATIAVTSDIPYEAVIEAADKSGCDLIFLASHGRAPSGDFCSAVKPTRC